MHLLRNAASAPGRCPRSDCVRFFLDEGCIILQTDRCDSVRRGLHVLDLKAGDGRLLATFSTVIVVMSADVVALCVPSPVRSRAVLIAVLPSRYYCSTPHFTDENTNTQVS